jgi:hypothetical protein
VLALGKFDSIFVSARLAHSSLWKLEC